MALAAFISSAIGALQKANGVAEEVAQEQRQYAEKKGRKEWAELGPVLHPVPNRIEMAPLQHQLHRSQCDKRQENDEDRPADAAVEVADACGHRMRRH